MTYYWDNLIPVKTSSNIIFMHLRVFRHPTFTEMANFSKSNGVYARKATTELSCNDSPLEPSLHLHRILTNVSHAFKISFQLNTTLSNYYKTAKHSLLINSA
jgi:hypothetical protein